MDSRESFRIQISLQVLAIITLNIKIKTGVKTATHAPKVADWQETFVTAGLEKCISCFYAKIASGERLRKHFTAAWIYLTK